VAAAFALSVLVGVVLAALALVVVGVVLAALAWWCGWRRKKKNGWGRPEEELTR